MSLLYLWSCSGAFSPGNRPFHFRPIRIPDLEQNSNNTNNSNDDGGDDDNAPIRLLTCAYWNVWAEHGFPLDVNKQEVEEEEEEEEEEEGRKKSKKRKRKKESLFFSLSLFLSFCLFRFQTFGRKDEEEGEGKERGEKEKV